jgi:hypothetical protein
VKVQLKRFATIELDRNNGRAEAIRVGHWSRGAAAEEWFFTTELGCECGTTSFHDDEILAAVAMPQEPMLPPEKMAPFLGVDQLSRAPAMFVEFWNLEEP